MRDRSVATPVRLILGLPLLLFIAACSSGGDGGPVGPPDPGDALAVTDLAATAGSPTSVTLAWTVPATVKADWTMHYDLRFVPLGEENLDWAGWTRAQDPTSDNAAGSGASHVVDGLEAGSTHVFRMRCSTDGQSWSAPSNTVVATAATVFDVTAPAPVEDLAFWSSTTGSVTLVWSPGADDGPYGTAAGYEVRYAQTDVNDATWSAATVSAAAITAAPNPALLTTTITGLQSGQEYHFAVKVADDMGHLSGVSNQVAATAERKSTLYIKVDGTGDYPTIWDGVYAAQAGDRILVAPGRYTWTNQGNGDPDHGLLFIERDMTGWDLVSEAGPEATILDAEEEAAVIFIQGYNVITIEGFTITGGIALDDPEVDPASRYAGGGITSHLNDARIVNCIITGNRATQGGGVWHGGVGTFSLIDCVIKNNEAELGGGVLLANTEARLTVRDCEIRNNSAEVGGGFFIYNVALTMQGCVIADNSAVLRAGGMYLSGLNEDCRLVNCTLAGNQAPTAAAIRMNGPDDGHPGTDYWLANMNNCVVAFNSGGAAFEAINFGGLGDVGCNLVFGNEGGNDWPALHTDIGGNLNLDPRFCSQAGLAPSRSSPCLPANHPDGTGCGLIGAVPAGTCP